MRFQQKIFHQKNIQFNLLAGNKTKGLLKQSQLNIAEVKTCNKGRAKDVS